MVLMYGIPGDGPFEMIADELENLDVPFLLLDQRTFSKYHFTLHLAQHGLEGYIGTDDKTYDLRTFTGIYNRALDFSMLPEAKQLQVTSPASYKQYTQFFSLLNQWIECCTCKVLNKASAMSSNSSKPYQLSLIDAFFATPPTLITNNTETIKAFEEKQKEIIYKSASSVRSVVKSVSTADENSLQTIRYCPTLFQQKLEGTNYRVHVVGDEIFATKITSESIDYRYSNREGNETDLVPVKLSTTIAEKCIALSKAVRLPLAGIDLFETRNGEWYCFEVNPSPGFSYFEKNTEQPIARAIARYLAGKS